MEDCCSAQIHMIMSLLLFHGHQTVYKKKKRYIYESIKKVNILLLDLLKCLNCAIKQGIQSNLKKKKPKKPKKTKKIKKKLYFFLKDGHIHMKKQMLDHY